MAEKPTRRADRVQVTYSQERWEKLKELRRKAVSAMTALHQKNIQSFVHGSVARGDVSADSDVDIIVPTVIPSHQVEMALALAGFEPYSREISQATPSHAPKAHIYLDPYELTSVTIPLLQFRRMELEFYRFGGILDLDGLRADTRVVGCTKRLTLIEPMETGHVESSILGREGEVSRMLQVSPDIVRERVRVLMRRDEIGRTGIFLKVPVPPNQTIEEALKRLVDTNPAVRRVFKKRE